MPPTLAHVDGFEYQLISTSGFRTAGGAVASPLYHAINGTPEIAVRSGDGWLKLTFVSGTAQRVVRTLPASTRTLVQSFYIEFEGSIAAANMRIARVAGPNNANLRYNSATGQFALAWGDGGALNAFGPVLAADTKYLIDWKVDTSANPRTQTASVNGGTPLTITDTGTAGDLVSSSLGELVNTLSSGSQVVYYNDWIYGYTIGDYPYGEHAVGILLPDGDGTHNAGTNVMEDQSGADIGVVTAYNLINEVPPEETDYIRQAGSGSGNYAEVTFEDPAAGDIWAVTVWATIRRSGAGDSDALIRVVDGSGNTLRDMGGTGAASLDVPQHSVLLVPDPGADGWTGSELAAVKARVGFASDVAPIPRYLTVALQYAYAPPGPLQFNAPSAVAEFAAPQPAVDHLAPTAVAEWAAPAPEFVVGQGPLQFNAPSAVAEFAAPQPTAGVVLPVEFAAPSAVALFEALSPASPKLFMGPEPQRRVHVARGLGKVVHTFTSPSGESCQVRVSDWAAFDSSRGHESAEGKISLRDYERWREVFRFGATWRTFLAESGECVWGGRLKEPAIGSREVEITAAGWSYRADREVQRLLYQTRDINEWRVGAADPEVEWVGQQFGGLGLSRFHDQPGVHPQTGKGWQTKVHKGFIKFDRDGLAVDTELPVVSQQYGISEQITFYAPGCADGLSRIAFVINTEGTTPSPDVYPTAADPGRQDIATDWSLPLLTIWSGTVDPITHDHYVNAVLDWIPDPREFAGHPANEVEALRGVHVDLDLTRHSLSAEITGSYSFPWSLDSSQPLPLTIDNRDDAVSELLDTSGWPNHGELDWVMIEMLSGHNRMGVYGVASGVNDDPRTEYHLVLSHVRVNGIAPDDRFTAAELVRDLAERMDIPHFIDEGTGVNILPYDMRGVPYADGLDFAATMADWRWRILDSGTGPYLEFGPWETHRWVTHSRDVRPLPLERYNWAQVAFSYNNDETVDTVRVHATNDTLDVRNWYSHLELPVPVHSPEQAEALGQVMIDYLAQERFGGDARLTEVIDETGVKRSAYMLRAGDVLYHAPTAREMRVASKRMTDREVEVRFDEGHAALDRWMARRAQRRAKRGKAIG